MDHNHVIAPCTLCRTVDELRPYGCQDALICIECAQKQAERMTAIVLDASERLKRLSN